MRTSPSGRSVQRKLFAGVLLTSVVATLLTGGSLFIVDLVNYRKISSADLAIQADLIANATTAALQFDDRAVAQQNLAFLTARPSIRAAAIYDVTGKPFASYTRGDVAPASVPASAEAETAGIKGDRLEVYRRVRVGDENLGTVYLQSDLEMGQRIAAYAAIAIAVTLAAFGLALLLSTRLEAGITRPITQISHLAHEVVAKRDYSLRARRTTDDEVGGLAEAFNEMLAEIERRTADLEATRDEIARLNKDLELRVLDRTAQLEESNLRLQAADTAKSRFLSMMSHEIRTPMNGVLGMLELLTLTELDEQQAATLGVVRESGRSLLRIIDDILDFSKIEAGKLEVRPEVASVESIVASVAGVYSGNASSKALTLRSRVDPRISPAVVVDPLRLQQILNNLVSNAIKFTSKGHVEVAAELVRRAGDEDVVRFSVEDTGIGISTEGQARLFEPFSQAGADVERVFGGTGLGLSIAQRLARLMGGTITMTSAPDMGTTMSLTLSLPVASPDALPAGRLAEASALEAAMLDRRQPPPPEQAEREGTLVLVVDDHPINRLVLMRQVTVLGYATETAIDGRDALEKWKSGRFGLVITDCNMPEMDGYELVGAIRALEREGRGTRTLVIACTANALRGEADKCVAAGMDDYMAKPVEISRLAAMLDRWLPIPGRGGVRTGFAPRSPASIAGALPVLDAEQLARICGGDASLRNEAFAEFKAVNDVDTRLLFDALEARDLAQVARLAHRIKGASRTLGAAALAQVCQVMEAGARANDWAAIVAMRETLRREVARLEEQMQA